ncbi:hypothetical protein J7L27_01805 [Candidatus Bathyarchaeota archaeon]|nr:hypothetical protein [Candidatus Bathyarchaeota archaeon]
MKNNIFGERMPFSRRFSTGIVGLDGFLGGGLLDNSLILVCGEVGSRHKTFVHQILFNHVAEDGKAAYYLAENMSIDILLEMRRFGWLLQDHLSRKSWIFVKMKTSSLQDLSNLAPKLLEEEHSVNLAPGLKELKDDIHAKVEENYWTAIELNYILLNFDLKEIMDLLLYWRTVARMYGGVHFAILPLGIHPENHVNLIKDIADGVLEFILRRSDRRYENLMIVRKMKFLPRPLMLNFTVRENGINVETTARIY